jgi:hypothetical protein
VLAALAGTLVAFGAFGILALLAAAVGLAIGVPLDLTPRDWRRLEHAIALAAALGAFVAHFFGGYVAARLSGHDGLEHGLRVFALAVVALGALSVLGLAMSGPASIGMHLDARATPTIATGGVDAGSVVVEATAWSLLAMLAGSVTGGVLGERAHRRRHPPGDAGAAPAGPR